MSETIRAKITKVEQQPDSEWFRISTDHDTIKRLDTKRRELAVEAERLRREDVELEIQYTSRPGKNINPHTNQPYVNYYFDAVRKAEQMAIAIPIAAPESTPGRKTDPNDAWRMCLNKGGELALLTLEFKRDDPDFDKSFEAQKQIARAWAYFFMTDPFPGETADNGSSAFKVPAGVLASMDGDDDIPF